MNSLYQKTQVRVLITGVTGFLGTFLTRHLIKNTEVLIIALVRSGKSDEAFQRLSCEWSKFPELQSEVGNRIQPVSGDITFPCLGLDENAYKRLVHQVTHILHLAADIRLFEPIETLSKVNMTGAKHVLEFAKAAHRDHGLQRLCHISTAYVSGERNGPVREDDLTDRFGFSNNYECSKFEVEQFFRRETQNLPVSIFRPGIIVGDSVSGTVKTFNTVYYPLRLYLSGQMKIIPTKASFHVDMAPVDYVAGAITRLLLDPRAEGLTFHLTPPWDAMPVATEIFEWIRKWARDEKGIALKPPIFLPLPGLEKISRKPHARTLLKKITGKELGNLLGLLPYFRKQPIFLRENTDRLIGSYTHRWQDSLPQQLEYAFRNQFGRFR